ncbi:heparinase II/III family protein [Verrucomicrobia bacterium]|nr:heparinase II/III family protein [Verrucomicrobiota bacterium]
MKIPSFAYVTCLWHTLIHLKWTQVVHRMKYRLLLWTRPSDGDSDAVKPEWEKDFSSLSSYQSELKCPFNSEEIRKGIFRFINIDEQIQFPPQWDFESQHKLWRYQLHYFDWIWALDYLATNRVIKNWITSYTYTRQRDGWEAYPVSMRLINWSLFFGASYRDNLRKDPEFQRSLCQSIQMQANWLERNIEYHLLANHLFENGVALVLCGCLFSGKDADRWRAKGLSILSVQVLEQLLPDGMHFERSPMYHVRMLYVLQLAHLSLMVHGINLWTNNIKKMQEALQRLLHPDHEITLFNDAGFGVYPIPPLEAEGHRETKGCWNLPEAGYFGYRADGGRYIAVDAGPIGPDYNPGHAHGDIFSYELSHAHRRIIVDAGNYHYESDALRKFCRSTKAHNTVEINGRDQCDFWGAFRVGMRGTPTNVAFQQKTKGFKLSGWHNGYRRLKENATHYREINYESDLGLEVTDKIHAKKSVSSISRIHYHPDCKLVEYTCKRLVMEIDGIRVETHWNDASEATLEESLYCPSFNLRFPNTALALHQNGSDIEIWYHVTFCKT